MPVFGDLPIPYGEGPYGGGPYGGDIEITPYVISSPLTTPPSFATAQDVLDAQVTTPVITVFIDGIVTMVHEFSADHSVDRSAIGSLTIPEPIPSHIVPGATVEVQAGHNDFVTTVFSGFIPSERFSLSMNGITIEVPLWGWSKLMDEDNWEELTFDNPVQLDTLFAAIAERMDVPSYIAEYPVYVDGVTPVVLGGNNNIDEGKTVIKTRSSPLSQNRRMAEDYGYRVYDLPSGPVTQQLIAGLPNTDPVVRFAEGWSMTSVEMEREYDTIVNYWDVEGQVYEDEFGAQIPIRSRPETVEVDDRIWPDGVRREGYSSNDIVRQDQADAIRQRLEIDTSEPRVIVTWNSVGLPGIAPGDVVSVYAPTVNVDGDFWIMSMRQAFSVDAGYATSWTAWAGAGEARESLIERNEIIVDDAVTHLGDEYVGWYANPSPYGTRKIWAFNNPEKATHVNIRAYAHSWNSQLSEGENTDLSTSKWEIWPVDADIEAEDARPELSGTMPVMPEDYLRRPNWSVFETDPVTGEVTNSGEWGQTAVSLAQLDPGDWELHFVVGDGVAGVDDGEVRRIRIETWGANDPAVIT